MNNPYYARDECTENNSVQDLIASIPQNDYSTLPVVVPNFLSAVECERVIELVEALQEHNAKVIRSTESLQYEKRKSLIRLLYPGDQSMWLFQKLKDLVVSYNKNYRFDIQGFFEGIQFAKYDVGGHFDWHMDSGPGDRSLRKLSISVQLSRPEEYDDGELEFFGQEQFAPKDQGTAIIFPAFLFHRVRTVTGGSRKVIITWVHGNPFR